MLVVEHVKSAAQKNAMYSMPAFDRMNADLDPGLISVLHCVDNALPKQPVGLERLSDAIVADDGGLGEGVDPCSYRKWRWRADVVPGELEGPFEDACEQQLRIA